MNLGFTEDFNKVILNSNHELIHLRYKHDFQVVRSVIASEKFKLSILNVTWKIPHIQLTDA